MKKITLTENGLIGWKRGILKYLTQFGVTPETEISYLNDYYIKNQRFNMFTGEPLMPKKGTESK